MPNHLLTLVSICSVLLLCRCANVAPPQGGPRDFKAPSLTEINPPNQSTETYPNRLTLLFDEYVQLNNFNKEIVINPYINPKYIKAKAQGKKIVIDFGSAFRPNTTYNIDFGKSITDVTERNAIQYNYTFSTGKKLDSLSISGHVLSSLNLQPAVNTLVGLYLKSDTLNPSNQKPLYFTKTDPTGEFQFNHLIDDEFQVFAFQDLNNNLLQDQKQEEVGFLPDYIRSTADQTPTIYLFKEDTRKFRMNRPVTKYNKVDISFTKGVSNITVDTQDPSHYLSETNTLRIYPSTNLTKLSLVAIDSNAVKIDTTINLSYIALPSLEEKIVLQQETNLNGLKPYDGIRLSSDYRIQQINTDSLSIIANGDTLPYDSSQLRYTLDDDRLELSFQSDNQIDTLRMIIKSGAIVFQTKQTNKPVNPIYVFQKKEHYGSISGTVTATSKNYIFYLLNAQNRVVSELIRPTTFSYPYLEPGTYAIKILIDTNANGRYDTGNLEQQQLPETFYLYNQPITVKSNWEQGNINISIE